MTRKLFCLVAVLALFAGNAFGQFDYYDYYDYYDDYYYDDYYYDYYDYYDDFYQYYTEVAIGVGDFNRARATARSPQNLNIGSSVSGFLGNGQDIWYSVRALQDGILFIETSNSNFDPYLEAYDANGYYITENDDGGEGLNAKIGITVSQGNVYLFKLRSYNNNSSGSFTITATSTPFTNLTAGRSVSGFVGSRQNIWYRFTAPQSGLLTVETTGSTDTIISAYDPDFYYLGHDDDSGESTNAKIRLDVVAGGTYYFDLRAWSENSGSFNISANYTAVTELNIGRSINGFIESSHSYLFRVQASESGLLTVETTGSTDTYLTAYDRTFNYLAEDDDSGAGLNAKIEIEVFKDNVYYFDLRAWSAGSGAYVIMANISPFPSIQLIPGVNTNRFIDSNQQNRYSVVAPRSGILVVEASGNAGIGLSAYDPDYSYLGYSENRIEVIAVAGRTYYFELDPWGGSWFNILARIDSFPAPVPLSLGVATGGYINNGVGQWYSIRTSSIPGGTIVIETTGNIDTFMEVYDESYNLIAMNDDGGEGLNARVELHVQANRTYIIRIRGYSSWVDGPYRIFANYTAFGSVGDPYILIAGN